MDRSKTTIKFVVYFPSSLQIRWTSRPYLYQKNREYIPKVTSVKMETARPSLFLIGIISLLATNVIGRF